MVDLGGRFGALSERPFRVLWVGQTTSAIGDALIGVALAFAVLELGGSAGDLGLVFAARTASSVVFVLAGGVWADRLPRRAVMLVADAIRAVVQAAVAVLLLSGAAEIWHLGVAGFISGAASAFFMPAATVALTGVDAALVGGAILLAVAAGGALSVPSVRHLRAA